jgi:hypothetical protein
VILVKADTEGALCFAAGERDPRTIPLAELDELYDLECDPYELKNLNRSPPARAVRERLKGELNRLASAALGL